jgi:hypothetical protein
VPHLRPAAVVRPRRRRRDHQRPGRHPRLPLGQPPAAPPGAGHGPPGQPHPAGGRRGRGVRGAGSPRPLAGCAGVLAGLGPGACLRRRAGQLRPASHRPRLLLAPAALSSDYQQNRRSAARLAELRPRLACFGHGFAVADPGRFAAAVDQLGPVSYQFSDPAQHAAGRRAPRTASGLRRSASWDIPSVGDRTLNSRPAVIAGR